MSENDDIKKRQLARDKEIEFLENLKSVLLKAKHELNNDLTKLAIRNLPIMTESDAQDLDASDQPAVEIISEQQIPDGQVNLSQSTINSDAQNSDTSHEDIQQLEPLDLEP